jgi:uncharacterized protein (DUF2236 family)
MSGATYFTDRSMVRRVHRERVVALGGPRALLLMAAHPVAFAGFFAHTGALGDPYARLRRTGELLHTITFGSRRRADIATRAVRGIHSRVRGQLREPAGRFPAGTPYAADDPALLLWIMASLVDSNLTVHDRYVRTLSRGERNDYWQDFRVIGGLFGLQASDMPLEIEDFERYVDVMLASPDLHVTEEARKLAIEIVLRPPVSIHQRPLLELANFITVGLLPDRLRRGYGLYWNPACSLALIGGAQYTKRRVLPLLPEWIRRSRSRESPKLAQAAS